MKKSIAITTALISVIAGIVGYTSVSTVFAQSNDQVVDSLLGSTRGYTASDKSSVKIISKTATTVTIEAPIATKDGKNITSYYITWAPISYRDITATSNTDDLAKVKASDTTKAPGGGPIYIISGMRLVFTIEVLEPTRDLYVTIAPEDATKNLGSPIEDFKFNLSTSAVTTTAVAGDTYNATNNEAISNVTCVRDATANRTTLLRDINTALNATKVEIAHRGDEKQGAMAIKGTPAITDRRFPIDTPHRDIQLFRLKPLSAAGAMVGKEIQYICKNDTLGADKDPTTPMTPIVPTDPKKPIPVTPHTGPLETTAIVFFVSILGYVVYKRIKA